VKKKRQKGVGEASDKRKYVAGKNQPPKVLKDWWENGKGEPLGVKVSPGKMKRGIISYNARGVGRWQERGGRVNRSQCEGKESKWWGRGARRIQC